MLDGLVARKVKEADRCALIAHIVPDGDTLGSVLAVSHALDHLGIPNDVYCEDEVPGMYRFLPGSEKVKKPPEPPVGYPLAVSIDVSDFSRLGNCAGVFEAAGERVVLDHHETNGGFGDHNVIERRSASAELALELIDELGVPVSPDIAVCLYVALATDTGNFNYENTTGDTLRTAARLLDVGIDVAGISKVLFRTRSASKSRLIGRAIANMRLMRGGSIAVMTLTREDYRQCGADNSETEGVINFGIECDGVDIAILARETGSGVKFSLRSNGKYDVGALAGKLGGGGHRAASGFTLEGPLEEAVERVCAAVVALMEADPS